MEAYRSGHNGPHSKCGSPFWARGFESHRFRQKGIVRTHAKVSSYFFLCMSALACTFPLKTYCLNRLFLRRGKLKSVMRMATLLNSEIGISNSGMPIFYCLCFVLSGLTAFCGFRLSSTIKPFGLRL